MQSILKALLVGFALCAWAAPTEAAWAQEAPPLPSPEELTGLLNVFDVPGLALATLTDCEVDSEVISYRRGVGHLGAGRGGHTAHRI